MEKVNGAFAIVFTMYNLRRATSILGLEELIKRLEAACLAIIGFFRAVLSRYAGFLFKFEQFAKFIFPQIKWSSGFRGDSQRSCF